MLQADYLIISEKQGGAGKASEMPSGYKHGDTPKRAMVRGTISYLESQGLPVNKSAIFRHFGLSRSQGYASLSIPASKRNDPEWEETRGRPMKISEAELAAMEAILWDARYEDVNLNWTGLAREAGVETECNARTLHRAMGTLGYRRCLTLPGIGVVSAGDGTVAIAGGVQSRGCARSWVHKKARERRVEYAERMLEAYPQPHNWRFVRFSCELHFGFGLDGKVRLIPKTGEKFCEDCQPQHQPAPQQQEEHQQPLDEQLQDPALDETVADASDIAPPQTTTTAAGPSATATSGGWQRDVKRLHAWAAIGFGFKSELVFYDDSTSPNNNGVMSMQDYVDKVLDPVVKTWLQPQPQPGTTAVANGGTNANATAVQMTTATNPDGTTVLIPAAVPVMVGGAQSFVLEEDVEAFAHGGLSKVNMVQGWKDTNGLRYYFGCLDSPDLSPLDSLWPAGKQWNLGDIPGTVAGTIEGAEGVEQGLSAKTTLKDWEPETLQQAAREAWEAMDQERVNVWVDFMPQRLRQVVASEGRMVPW